MSDLATTLALGLAIGTIMALTGAGGGVLAVPLLVFCAGLGVAQAGPIGLLAVGIAAGIGALLGLRAGIVRYRAALLMAGAGMLLSPLGLWLAHLGDDRALAILFAGVLLLVAWNAARQALQPRQSEAPADPGHPCVRDEASGRFQWTASCARFLVLAGSAAGLLSGLLGVGGGFVIVPALRRYTDLDMRSTVATSLAVIALVALAGVLGGALAGTVDWTIALPFAAGTVIGMLGGRALAGRLRQERLQLGFAIVAVAVAAGMVVSAVA